MSRRSKRKAMTPPLVELPENTDPLQTFDRLGNYLETHPLRNLWSPAAGFLVGSGPSLNTVDLGRLRERGIASLGINNAAAYAPCKSFVCSDPPEKFHHGVFFDPGIMKFVPHTKLRKRVRAKLPDGSFRFTRYNVCDCPNVFAFHRRSVFKPEEFLTTEWASWGNNSQGAIDTGRQKAIFTWFIGLRLMVYLGVRRIYLLGVDFAMKPSGKRESGQYAFDQAGVGLGNNSHYRVAADYCIELKPHLEAAGIEVYQTNPASRLTAFPHVGFDAAIEDCRGVVPVEPFDLAGWYEKQTEPAEPQVGPD